MAKKLLLNNGGGSEPLLIDFTQSTTPTYPSWFSEANKSPSSYFTHGQYRYDSSLYGLKENNINSTNTIYWTCYKVVAPVTGTLKINFRVYAHTSTSYPFVIHATSNTTQPSYASTTDSLIKVNGTTYRAKDGTASLKVTEGETYYIHIQHRRHSSSSSTAFGACIRKIEIEV